MINPHYDHDSAYHSGDAVEQDVKAWLGIWKSLDEVPHLHRLSRFTDIIDVEDSWDEFVSDYGADWSEHTLQYAYGKGWREWLAFCDERRIHPACPTPEEVEEHLAHQRAEMSTNQTLHDTRFRPLFYWWEWMRYHVDYPVKYNPALMAVLLGGVAYDAWKTRVSDRLWKQEIREQEMDLGANGE